MIKKNIIKKLGQRNHSLNSDQSGSYGKTYRDFIANGGFTNLAYYDRYISLKRRSYSSKRYFSNSTRLFNNNNGFNKNSNNESGRNNISKFLSRITISMIVGIIVKSLFLSWYNDTFSWIGLWDNIYSLHSGLIAIGCLTNGLINKLLDLTSFNIKIRDLFSENPIYNLKRLWNLLLSCRSYSFDYKLCLGVNEELSGFDLLFEDMSKIDLKQLKGKLGFTWFIIKSRGNFILGNLMILLRDFMLTLI